jgi:NitT/TauT family transport system substrate-binding protein
LFVICGLWGCQNVTSQSIKRSPLKVACITFVGYRPAVIAQEKGFFKAQGVDVELNYVDFAQLQQADFSAGKYDGIGLTLGDFIILSANNPNMQSVLVVDETNGADVVVAQSDIKTVEDLKGKKIGANLGGFSEVFVTEMLRTSNLTTDDVNLVKFDALEIPQRLKNNDIQAGHTWEPFLSEAIKQGARPLFTSKQTPGLILDLVAFRNETIRDRPQDVRAFVRGWLQALNFWEQNLEAGNEIITKTLKIPLDTISLDGVNLTNLQENQEFFRANSTNSIYDIAKIYADFFIRSGNVTRLPDLKSLFNSSFLN